MNELPDQASGHVVDGNLGCAGARHVEGDLRLPPEGIRPRCVQGEHRGQRCADLHRGYGGGVRFGMGENFTVAVDMGRSEEAGMPLYIGLGYLY